MTFPQIGCVGFLVLVFIGGVLSKFDEHHDQESLKVAVEHKDYGECGDPPSRSPLDGGMYAVDRYMRRDAYDPKHTESENCSSPDYNSETWCWHVVCTVRGKNAFGMNVSNKVACYIKDGSVTTCVNLEGL